MSALAEPDTPKKSRGPVVAVVGVAALLAMLLGVGVAWFMSSLPAAPEPEVLAPVPMPDFTPAYAVLPWKRDPGVANPVWVATAQTPWRRTASEPARVWVAPATLPWQQRAP